MREETKMLCQIYNLSYTEEEILSDGFFKLKAGKKTTNILKKIEFIKENSFLNNFEDIFLFKIKVGTYTYYFSFITYKNIKLEIQTEDLKIFNYRIYTTNNKWERLTNYGLKEYGITYNGIDVVAKELFENIKNNTQERLYFMLNKK